MKLTLVPARSRLSIETHATGLLSKLAHDLSISAKTLTGSGEEANGEVRFELEVPVAGLAVEGVLRAGSVDSGVLSASDRREIERKIREEVLPHASVSIVIVSAGAWPPPERVSMDVTVALGARRATIKTHAVVSVEGESRGFRGRLPLSTPALGMKPVKGPLNAFRVNDVVEVVFDLWVDA